MKLNMACSAQPGHKKYLRQELGAKSTETKPTVISSKRFESIMSRSRADERHEALAAVEEEQRYKQYLKDGSDALCNQFTNFTFHKVADEATLQNNLDKLLAEKTKDLRAKQLLDEQRKERIMRANRLLHLMKPGPRALHQALLHSDMIKQRKYNDAVNEDIAQDAIYQKHVEERQCPEVIIPFGQSTEEQEKAEQKEKSLLIRAHFLRELEERRQRKVNERKQEIYDAAVQRDQIKCMMDREDKAVKEQQAIKREASRRAYKDAIREKAERDNFEQICEQIDDRIRCVNRVAQRTLDTRYGQQILEMRANLIRDRAEKAAKICQLQQDKNQKQEEIQAHQEEVYEAEMSMDDLGRKCRQEELSKQRRAYQLGELYQEQQKKLRDAEIRRFEIARRYRNVEANKRFFDSEKLRQKKVKDDLREFLVGQREEFLQQQHDEAMRTASCQEDPCLQDDVDFFDEAAKLMEESKELGRPLYPIAKAVETYKIENPVETIPERELTTRNTARDVCWPHYFSKAELAYKKYADRDICRQENEEKRNKIFDNCIKISKMATAERPFNPSVERGIIKCLQHRGIPVLESDGMGAPNETYTQSVELEEPVYETVDSTIFPIESNSQVEENMESTAVEKKESSTSAASERHAGGLDPLLAYKRDGISRSLIGKVSTKQKRSTKSADVKQKPTALRKDSILLGSSSKGTGGADLMQSKQNESSSDADQKGLKMSTLTKHDFSSNESPRSVRFRRNSGSAGLLSRSAKLPDLNRYLIDKQNQRSAVSKNVELVLAKDTAGFPKQKPFKKLPDLTRYTQKNRSPKPFGVAELLAPDDNNLNNVSPSHKTGGKLPDLTQYWTPAVKKTNANQAQSTVLPTKDLNQRSHKSENRKQTS